ncbi:hypothetical protein [Umezakia ovalisporum]|uniref:Uncharacterized protein n=1 Tax=Umezakia ovalisporum FSS-62 TaxID=2971776 RepID=A0AA43KF55_9CYAN|nr:hypothetical protein [Umezakia ovalisporum]MDH6064286.1 hypothetical protein [Umezakia ovalisporum FSS-62]
MMIFVATSNKLCVQRPWFFVDLQPNPRLVQQRKVAEFHEHIANSRKYSHRKIAYQLCDPAQVIFLEDLSLVVLSKGTLGKHCQDA